MYPFNGLKRLILPTKKQGTSKIITEDKAIFSWEQDWMKSD